MLFNRGARLNSIKILYKKVFFYIELETIYPIKLYVFCVI